MTLQASEQVTGLRRYVPGLASITNGVKISAVTDSRAALTVQQLEELLEDLEHADVTVTSARVRGTEGCEPSSEESAGETEDRT